MSRTGADSRSCSSSFASQCSRVSVREAFAEHLVQFGLVGFTRWSWLLKRRSTDRSGRPSALQMSSSGLALKAPTSTSGPVWVWNTPDSGMAAQFTSESAIMIMAASCICMAASSCTATR
jgi:hypothetical protein